MFDEIPIMRKSALKGKSTQKKQVSFNEQGNRVHRFVKHKEENMNQEEKRAFMENLQMHRFGFATYDDEEEEIEEEVQEEVLPSSSTMMPGWVRSSGPERSEQRPTSKPTKKVKVVEERELKQNYGGKALEMMKKMGYNVGQGLGKNQQGITTPVQAVAKKALQGGADPLDILYADEDEEPVVELDATMKKLDKRWKKSKKVAKKKESENSKETREEHTNLSRSEQMRKVELGDTPRQTFTIVDMTGTNTISYNSVAEALAATQEDTSQQQPSYQSIKESYQEGFQQLNDITLSLQNRIDKLYNKQSRLQSNIKSEHDKLVMFDFELKQKQQAHHIEVERVQLGKAFLHDMDALRDYWESNAASIGPLLERFIALFQSYKAEFHDYKVHILCLKLVSETLEKRIEGWNGPTLASSQQQLHDEHKFITRLMILMKDVFVFKKTQSILEYAKNLGDKYSSLSVQNNRISHKDFRLVKRFVSYVTKPICAKLRMFIVNEWVPEEEEDFNLLDFIQTWSQPILAVEIDENDGPATSLAAFPQEYEIELLEQLILPRICKSIEGWSHKQTDKPMLHTWLLAWYVYIKQLNQLQLGDLNKTIMAKLSQSLQQWQPIQSWGFQLLAPWKGFIEEEKWENLILRVIVPKLMLLMETAFEINPANQQLQSLNIVLQWIDLLSEEHVQILLESAVFQELERVLDLWKANDGDEREIRIWIKGWKQTLLGVTQKCHKFAHIIGSLEMRL